MIGEIMWSMYKKPHRPGGAWVARKDERHTENVGGTGSSLVPGSSLGFGRNIKHAVFVIHAKMEAQEA